MVENSLSQNSPSILVSLRDPGLLTQEASAPVIEPKMAASALNAGWGSKVHQSI